MKPAVVVDLDGTLLKTNTFSDYIAYSFCKALHACRWALTFRILRASLKRKLRLISHAELKHQVLQLSTEFIQPHLDEFVHRELKYLNKELLDYLRNIADASMVLATSAPEFYSALISKQLGFDACLATAENGPDNCGKTKAERINAWLTENNACLQLVVTDHHDDLPLLELCGHRLLVNPSRKTLMRLSGLPFEIFEKYHPN